MGWPHGQQRLQLALNGKVLASTKLTNSTPKELVFPIPPGLLLGGVNILQLETPDAGVASAQDPRIISVALVSFGLR